ncbi:hypothetical protein PHLGIDRAFT_463327 [Phlebiopsis gigantea 11061_1 CR5-6]|uniref:Uncharacterized protein n=1 Tax=Phlebiopsis gigantea (strain 11061_1 CR5-6) TaxID=745531 RepID=A0A0C3PJI9_PHLG1|nr:hypothetical protein PHLGIDRAFT_463327 [Phlebiopsis gigantea 11061_1 CR5-6]
MGFSTPTGARLTMYSSQTTTTTMSYVQPEDFAETPINMPSAAHFSPSPPKYEEGHISFPQPAPHHAFYTQQPSPHPQMSFSQGPHHEGPSQISTTHQEQVVNVNAPCCCPCACCTACCAAIAAICCCPCCVLCH